MSVPRTAALLGAWLLTGTAAAQSLSVAETDEVIALRHDGKSVVTYNKVSPPAPSGIDPVYRRSGCLHPVVSPRGRTLTAMFPFDHPHQHGIFSAWVKTKFDGRDADFWNLAGRQARVLHERVVSTFNDNDGAGLEVDLIHRIEAKPAVDVLRERWKVTLRPTGGSHYCFDLQTTQTAITDKPLLVSKHHYGGIVLRGPTRWLTPADNDARQRRALVREPSRFLNDQGSDRRRGNHQHAKWVCLTGEIEGRPASIAALCHADNFRAPQAARLHPTKPYFCFAPCVDGAFQIDREHPFRGQYRFLVTDAKPDSQWLDDQWQQWCGQ